MFQKETYSVGLVNGNTFCKTGGLEGSGVGRLGRAKCNHQTVPQVWSHLQQSRVAPPSSGCAASLQPPLVSDDGLVRCVDHGGVVDGGEVAVGQVKLVEAQQSRPDGFDLHVGKVLADAAVAA